ncbi:O-antigen ligase family protein [Paenibacillus xylanilyticus]|nr:O-antigen ligase family protein [Paenibacillus xylanilyticus]
MNQKATMHVSLTSLQMLDFRKNVLGSLAFIIALLSYSLFSAPFPVKMGIAEILIGGLLVLFVSIPTGLIVMTGGFTLYQRYHALPMWLHMGFFLLLWWGLFNGGIIQGWNVTDIVRDIIPCVYLFVPMLLLPAMQRSGVNWLQYLPWIIAIMGVILSLRFYQVAQISPLDVGRMYYFDNFLYLSYDPSVIFAGIYLPLMAVHTWKSNKLISWLGSLMMVLGGFLALGSLMAVAQRAPLALAALCFGVYLLVVTRQSFKKLLLLILLLVGIWLFAQDQIQNSYQLLVDKQESFGANGKTDELAAVLKETSQSPFTLLFGVGWGGVFHDPAVDNMQVTYTHSALTFFMLKGGIIGIIIFLSYLLWICRNFLQGFSMSRFPLILACVVPIFIGLLFQVSYKTLSYGMILTLVCLLFDAKRVENENIK